MRKDIQATKNNSRTLKGFVCIARHSEQQACGWMKQSKNREFSHWSLIVRDFDGRLKRLHWVDGRIRSEIWKSGNSLFTNAAIFNKKITLSQLIRELEKKLSGYSNCQHFCAGAYSILGLSLATGVEEVVCEITLWGLIIYGISNLFNGGLGNLIH